MQNYVKMQFSLENSGKNKNIENVTKAVISRHVSPWQLSTRLRVIVDDNGLISILKALAIKFSIG